MKVLLVDDNEELRGVLVQSLEELAIEARGAQDESRALQWLEGERFDAFLVDSEINGRDGLALVEKLLAHKNGRGVPTLLMSNVGTALAKRMAKAAGCTDLVARPFGMNALADILRALERANRR